MNTQTNGQKPVFADLHMHTTASDGELEPMELVAACATAGLSVIAVTDHDSIESVLPAIAAARNYGIRVVPGVELSTELDGTEVHILGYFFDPEDRDFSEWLTSLQGTRYTRAQRILEKLEHYGLRVEFDLVRSIAGDGAIGRPHIARAMVESGVIGSYQAAFDYWIGDGKPACIAKSVQAPEELIRHIHQAGGIAVLAHPGKDVTVDRMRLLSRSGLDGIEIWHPRHSPAAQKILLDVARRFGLLITGGSDLHLRDRIPDCLGTYGVSAQIVEKLENYAQKRGRTEP
ncbi:MAG TPA: PHP domain-containing protein [Bacteroidetes bacterium]|nr:PHP domain-containing protein [Bacteroidota bacterium]